MPPSIFLVLGRKLLKKNLAIRKVTTALFGSIFIIMLHRWVAMHQEEMAHAIIAVDLFIIGAGFASCAPVLTCGFFLALLSIGIGVCNFLYPQTVWTGTLGLALSSMVLMSRDGWRLWKKAGTDVALLFDNHG